MIVYREISRVRGFLFDIDSTLYRNEAYFHHQHDVQIERLAEHLHRPQTELMADINRMKSDFSHKHGGRKLSLGNVFLTFGVTIQTSVAWREELIRPENYLSADPLLFSLMRKLQGIGPIVCVTNNPKSIGLRTLRQLGVEETVVEILGMDEFYLSKPNKEIFNRAFALLGVDPCQVVAVGDRYAIDLELPEKMGAAAVLVENMRDVYMLHDLIEKWQAE